MSYYKEIVTKAVIGKGKKSTKDIQKINVDSNVNNILGCWVINHNFSGTNNNSNIVVNGTYDINIWYSYDNNSKTNVMIKRFNYSDPMNVRIKENSNLTSTSEIIVKCLGQPSVIDVDLKDGVASLTVEKQMGVEVVGDSIVRVSVTDEVEEYEDVIDDYDVSDDYLT